MLHEDIYPVRSATRAREALMRNAAAQSTEARAAVVNALLAPNAGPLVRDGRIPAERRGDPDRLGTRRGHALLHVIRHPSFASIQAPISVIVGNLDRSRQLTSMQGRFTRLLAIRHSTCSMQSATCRSLKRRGRSIPSCWQLAAAGRNAHVQRHVSAQPPLADFQGDLSAQCNRGSNRAIE